MRTNSLLGNFEDIEASMDPIKEIEQFIKANYNYSGHLHISIEPNENGRYVVNCNRSVCTITSSIPITSLTNGIFEWGEIGGDFDCSYCKSLINLEGAPKEVNGSFYCHGCISLTSLEGGPWWVNGDFSCNDCQSLTSLKGAPKEVGGNFNCSWCYSLTSLEGAPEEVGRDFYCLCCGGLISLEGITEKIGMNYVFTGSGPIKAPKNIPANIIESVARYTTVERTE